MYNPQIVADRQRDIKIAEGYFADFPGGKWRQRSPESTAYGDASAVIQSAVQRGRANRDDNASTRFARLGNVLVGGGARKLARYNGFGGYSRFGAFGDDVTGAGILDASNVDTGYPSWSDNAGYVSDSPASASAADDGPGFWSTVGGGLVSAGSSAASYLKSPQGQAAVSGKQGILSSALSWLSGSGTKAPAPGQKPAPSKMPYVLGGGALLLGLYLVSKAH